MTKTTTPRRNATPTHHVPHLVASSCTPASFIEPSTDLIRARAFENYAQRRQDGTAGDELSDWLQAERDLRGQTLSSAGG